MLNSSSHVAPLSSSSLYSTYYPRQPQYSGGVPSRHSVASAVQPGPFFKQLSRCCSGVRRPR